MGRKKASYNIHDYVKDYTFSFDEKGFNEIDGLVLTQISNMDLDSSEIDIYSDKSKSVEQIWKDMRTEGTAAHAAYLGMSKDNRQLIEELASSNRYKNMSLSNFVKDPAKSNIDGFPSVGNDESMEQFAAVTITYEQNEKIYNYVSFRATDGSSDGWSEDFAMLYSTRIQAQADGTAYLNIIDDMTTGYITGGGHSKGGGVFEYAYLFCNEDVRERIVKGYVYDSPGVNEEVLSKTDYYEQYQDITNGSFICPQDSIIGQVLHEGDNASFVHSVESGFNQHDPYSWEIDPDSYTFVPDEQTPLSVYLNDVLDSSVCNMTQEEKEAFFAFVSYLLYNNGGEGIDGLIDLFATGWKDENGNFNWGKLREVWDVLSDDWENMSSEEREAFLDSLGTVVGALASTGVEFGKEKIEEWIERKAKEIEQKIQAAKEVALSWLDEKRVQFTSFLSNVYKAVVSGLKRAALWLGNFSVGGRYATENPYVRLDTYKLNNYAQRLLAVNRRIQNIDHRLDSLYWRVGLLGLWNLIQADVLTGYSWRLLRCSAYLSETAADFDALETKLGNCL